MSERPWCVHKWKVYLVDDLRIDDFRVIARCEKCGEVLDADDIAEALNELEEYKEQDPTIA